MRPTRLFRVTAAARRHAGSTTPRMGMSLSLRSWGSAVVDTVPQATRMALMSKVRRKRTSCRAYFSRISAERPP